MYDSEIPSSLFVKKEEGFENLKTFLEKLSEEEIEKQKYYKIKEVSPKDKKLPKWEIEKKLSFIGETKIPALFLENPNIEKCEKPLLVYYHGAGETVFKILEGIEEKWFAFIAKYYDILIVELPGYPFNHEKDFSAEMRNKQIDDVYNFLEEQYKNKYIIVGYSLGCHFALLLAGKENNSSEHLCLLNPFLTDKTAANYLSKNYVGKYCCLCCGECLSETVVTPIYKEKLNNADLIKKVKCPIAIFYSFKDDMVDPKDSDSLYLIAKNNSQRCEIYPHFYHNKNELIDPFTFTKLKNVLDKEKEPIPSLELNHRNFPVVNEKEKVFSIFILYLQQIFK